MDFVEFESQTGLRFSWNIWPGSKEDEDRINVPLSCMFTPLHNGSHESDAKHPLVDYEPLICRSSGIVLNPYCQVDFRAKTWICPVSGQRTPFPPSYAEHITPENLPSELTHLTMEYILPNIGNTKPTPPVILFLLDTCLPQEEFDQLRDAIQQAISNLPPTVLIGLITFGSIVRIYELGESDITKTYVFRGTKDHTGTSIKNQLALTHISAISKFVQPVGDCEFSFNLLLEDLTLDNWPHPSDSRPNRCTGAALSAALGLLECVAPGGGRVMLFVGGACTYGPGQVVDTPLRESIRHHLDIIQESPVARYVKSATKYYTDLANRAATQGHAIDIFACSLDQVGLHEMNVCCDKTGGYLVLSDSFSMSVFLDSLKMCLSCDESGNLNHGYKARVHVYCSNELRVCGALGNCHSLKRKSSYVSSNVIGEGETCEWSISALDNKLTIAFYFELASEDHTLNTIASAITGFAKTGSEAKKPDEPKPLSGKRGFIQFQTWFYHPSGRSRLRVTSISSDYNCSILSRLAHGFDQEAAAALMARLCIFKMYQEDSMQAVKWLDRRLIKTISNFAEYQHKNPQSFKLLKEFGIYPQFMYHLRRSHFLQTFNASPDETAYYRAILFKENVMNSLVMIQPALLEYTIENPTANPVLLDALSLKPDVILLLDCFFHVVIWYGETIHSWHQEKYQDLPEYQHFKDLLQAPANDAKEILAERFPVPKFVVCHAGGSQARFLLAKVNPSTTHSKVGFNHGSLGNTRDDSVVNTDDVSLKIFMDHLIKVVVEL